MIDRFISHSKGPGTKKERKEAINQALIGKPVPAELRGQVEEVIVAVQRRLQAER